MSVSKAVRRLRRGINQTEPESQPRRIVVKAYLTLIDLRYAIDTGIQVRGRRKAAMRQLYTRQRNNTESPPLLDTAKKARRYVKTVLEEEIG